MSAIILQFGANTDRARSAMSQLATTVTSNMTSVATVVGGTALANKKAFDLISTDYRSAGLAVGRFLLTYQALIRTVALVGITVANASSTLSQLVSIGDKAAAVRLSPETFQAFVREAGLARIATKDAESALTAFAKANKLSFDASNEQNPTQASPLGKLLQDLVLVQRQLENSPALDRFLNAGDQNERLRATIDIIRELQKAQQDLAAVKVAETAFGGKDAEKFAEQIRQGKLELDEVIGKGKAAGVIFSDSLVAQARELRDRLEAAGREISDNLTPFLRGSVDLALALGGAFTSAAEAVGGITNALGGVLRAIGAAQSAAAGLIRTLGQVATAAGAAAGGKNFNITAEDVPELRNQIADIDRRVAGIRERTAPSRRDAPNIEIDRLLSERQNLENRLRTAPSAPVQGPDIALFQPGGSNVIVPLPPTRPANLGQNRGGGGGGRAQTDERLETVKAYIEALEKANRLAEAEVKTFGLGNVEREKAIALAKLSVEATEAEKQKILEIAESTGVYRERLAELEKQQRQNAEAARYFGDVAVDALSDMIFEGKKAEDVLKNIGKSIGRSALQGLLTGQGPLGSIGGKGGILGALGGLLGLPGKAGGGSVMGGQGYLIGEQGPEIFLPGQSGTIIPNDAFGARGGGQSVTFVINAPGADAAQLQAVRRELQQLKSGFRQSVVSTMLDVQTRGTRP